MIVALELHEGRALIKPRQYLGDHFDRYRAACDGSGAMFDRELKCNTAPLEKIADVVAALNNLTGYASSVRMDRRDKTKEFALQTVDWCEGLNEQVEEARDALAKLGVKP